MDAERASLGGRTIGYRRQRSGGASVVLLHGMGSASRDWLPVAGSRHARPLDLVAPDLLGHGTTGAAGGDYSPPAQATMLRDLLDHLGVERTTLVGHSFGGGVALQFAFQFPHRCERLVLVSSGGLGREVSWWLRLASLPGASFALTVAERPQARSWIARARGRAGQGEDSAPPRLVLPRTAEGRTAYVRTVRSVIGLGGQRVTAHRFADAFTPFPALLIWGDRDPVIPVSHAARAGELFDDHRIEIFRGSGHAPHRDDPDRFADLVSQFLQEPVVSSARAA